jgi:hypothetical protein
MLSEPVPVTGSAPNFSPIPLMAPPPFGRLMDGALKLGSGCLAAEVAPGSDGALAPSGRGTATGASHREDHEASARRYAIVNC